MPSRGPLSATLCAVVGLLLAVSAIAAGIAAGADWNAFVESYLLTNVVVGIGFLASGVVIRWHRPANPVGLILIACGFGHLVSAIGAPAAQIGVEWGWPEIISRIFITLLVGAWHWGLGGFFPVALLLFPDGHLPSRRWAPVLWFMIAATVIPFLLDVTNATPTTGDVMLVPILSFGWEVPEVVTTVASIAPSLSILLAIVALIVRYVRGDDTMRRQLLWLILAVVAMLAINAQRWFTGNGPVLLLLTFVLIPIAIAIAIVRYRLLDIRVVLSRTLLYGALIAIIIALYAGLVAGVSLLVPPDADRIVAIGAALVVAFAFAPLRVLLQRLVGRAFYGTRSDPALTAARIGSRIGSEAGDVEAILDQARQALRMPRLELIVDGENRASVGPLGDHTVDLPLGGDTEATLRVTLRTGDIRLHDDDRRTLELVGTPLALLVRSLALADQLRAARASTVEARERERAVLHRDLHDGLGPTLTSAAYRTDAALNLLESEPASARDALTQAGTDVRAALAEVRRVVYGLRPLELEERGLWGSLRHRASQPGRLAVRLSIPDPPPELSPAAEVAAYRIINEALANAERHSSGTNVTVEFSAGSSLGISVVDDGRAPETWREGVGIRSIRDRAEELDGHSEVGPVDSGWRVAVELPI
ncbi:hypothetical protein BH10ACT7_BH10ACT7_14090 [soil metagenome]